MTESMQRQGSDYFDLYVLHRDDPSVPVGPIVEALNAHKNAGRIGAFGGSNWSWQRIKEANDYAAGARPDPVRRHQPELQPGRDVRGAVGRLPLHQRPAGAGGAGLLRRDGIAVMPWSSMAGGFFSDTYHRDNLDTFAKDDYFAQICIRCYCGETNFQRLDRARELAQAKNVTVAQIALAFTFSQPMNLFPLVSSLTKDQFAANAAALRCHADPAGTGVSGLEGGQPA